MPEYGDKGYWDERYEKANGEMFDWLQCFGTLSPILEQYVKPSDRIINLGCGNAKLSEEMHLAGYVNQWNIDYSEPVIKQM